jgi:hypothetical protein
MYIPNIFRETSPQGQIYQPLLPSSSQGEDSSSPGSSSPRGQAYEPPNPTNIGKGGLLSSRQPVESQQHLPTQTTNTQKGKSDSKTSDKLAEILNTLENASSDPKPITDSIKEISELGVHNTSTQIRFFTRMGNNRGNNSQQYNLAHPTSSGIAYNQLVLLNQIVTKLIEIKKNNEGHKTNVVDCLLNLSKCIDTHDTLDKTGPNNNQEQVRSEIRKKIKDDEDVTVRYREIVMAAVKKNGSALEYASKELRGNKEVVLAAVQQDWRALQNASDELKRDHEVVMAAVGEHGDALQYASKKLKRDHEVVMAAVKKNGSALQYASEDLRGDKEVVMAAVRQGSTWCLEYASEDLRGNKDVVMAAVQHNAFALSHASKGLRGDKKVVLAAVKYSGLALSYASEGLRGDKEFVLEAVKKKGSALQYASEDLRGNKDVVMAAVQQDGSALQYASKELKRDPEFSQFSG